MVCSYASTAGPVRGVGRDAGVDATNEIHFFVAGRRQRDGKNAQRNRKKHSRATRLANAEHGRRRQTNSVCPGRARGGGS